MNLNPNMKDELRSKQLKSQFEVGQFVRHTGTNVEGMIHEIHTLPQVVNTPNGPAVRQLSEPMILITYLDTDGRINTFTAGERFFEAVA